MGEPVRWVEVEKVMVPRICRVSTQRNERTKELLHIESMFTPYGKHCAGIDLSETC